MVEIGGEFASCQSTVVQYFSELGEWYQNSAEGSLVTVFTPSLEAAFSCTTFATSH